VVAARSEIVGVIEAFRGSGDVGGRYFRSKTVVFSEDVEEADIELVDCDRMRDAVQLTLRGYCRCGARVITWE
jgi:hypothetical protein